MIYLIFGEDKKRSLALLEEFKGRFRREVPSVWDSVDCDDDGAFEKFGASSLFSPKEYRIIKNPSRLPENTLSDLKLLLDRWSKNDSVIVVYEDGVPLGKNKIFAAIEKWATKKQEFSALTGQALSRWIDEELKKRAASLSPDDKGFLMARYGGDLWKLEGEMDKLILGGVRQESVAGFQEKDIFQIADLWARRERSELLLRFDAMMRAGFEADNVLRILLWQIKTLFTVRAGIQEKLNPYVERKAREQAHNFSPEALEDAYRRLITIDANEKRGVGSSEVGLLHFFLTT